MKKILLVTQVFWPENFVINDLVEELKKRGYQVDILTHYPSYPESYVYDGYKNENRSVEMWRGSKIYRFKFVEGYKNSLLRKLGHYFSFVRGGYAYVDKIDESYDYVLACQIGTLTIALPAIKAAKKFNAKLILWIFDLWPDGVYAYGFKKTYVTNILLSKFIKYVYSKCDNIFVSSHMFISAVKELVQNKEITYIPNWAIDPVQKDSDIELDKSKFNITFTGNISRFQNLENVIKAFISIDDSIVLNIVGNGSKFNDLKSLIESNNIKNVILHGYKEATYIQDILSKSDALLLSLIPDIGVQKTEPFKIQSYLRSGKPILGVISGAGEEIITSNNIGICANPDNISDIIDKIHKITEITTQEKLLIAKRSKELIDNRYNRDRIIDNMIQYLK